MTPPAIDPKASYQKLRDETASMLGLGPEPSLIENLQIDLISLLRLEVDGLQGNAFAGSGNIDLDRLAAALAMLQKLFPESSLRAVSVAEETASETTHARAQLIKLVDAYAEARQQQLAANPDAARAALEEELKQALGERYSPPPAPAVELAAPSPAEAAPEPTPEPPPDNVVPLREGVDCPMRAPEGFRRTHEPWRDFMGGGRSYWPGSEPRGSREW